MHGRSAFATLLIVWLVASAGCAVCENCEDYAFSAYGGKWQRTDRYRGRVGSIFDAAGAPVSPVIAGESVVTDGAIMSEGEPTLAEPIEGEDVPWDANETIELIPPQVQ